MPFASEPEFLVLHALRVKGFAEPDAIAVVTGLDRGEIDKYLDAFESDGLVRHRAGAVSGWTLTGTGRAEDERRAAEELDASGSRKLVVDAYRRFTVLNTELLQLCTSWQLRDDLDGTAVNDHTDERYDRQVIERLEELDERAQPVCTSLADALARFAHYGPRLSNALARVQAGERDWFARPTIDSYHTVWFELHEDLLATLGIERGRETA